jgi:hypothetical protein
MRNRGSRDDIAGASGTFTSVPLQRMNLKPASTLYTLNGFDPSRGIGFLSKMSPICERSAM